MSILDDNKYLNGIDKSKMLLEINNFSNYLLDCLNICQKSKVTASHGIKNMVIAGLGGSAIGGDIIRDWIWDKIPKPLGICREYKLPGYANEETLLIVVSYSGETEETINMFLEGIERKCKIFTITSNGLLEKLSRKYGVPLILIPRGMQPRAALPYLFTAISYVLWKNSILDMLDKEIKITANQLTKAAVRWNVDVTTKENHAKQLALSIKDTFPIIYASNRYGSVGRRFKDQINENSKILAKFDVIPESCHNDIEGWSGEKRLNQFSIVFISDELERDRRIEEMKRVLAEKGLTRLYEFKGFGESRLSRLLSAIVFGDFVSFYLSMLYHVDPTPVSTINLLKERLYKESDYVVHSRRK